MANSYFQFKQFRINQDRCAMKVCTDSCVLGAYANVAGVTRVLDIGTGTGLLSLMLAQRSNAVIEGVEVEADAYGQAQENVRQSPWADQIRLYHSRIQDFSPANGNLYDLIIANPPFFSNHLKRKTGAANVALHSESLSLAELAKSVHRLLAPRGRVVVMLPEAESRELEKILAFYGLIPVSELQLYEREHTRLMRLITTYSRRIHRETDVQTEQLIIRDNQGEYTSKFVQLLTPYYLYL